jgi:type VI secretion system secreted protein Hcp
MGVTQSGSMAHGGGGGEGKASFHDFTFTHHIDKASPVLLKACATGEHIKDATITVRKAGKGQQEYLIIKLTDVIVTSVALGEAAATSPARTSPSRSPRSTSSTSPRRPTDHSTSGSTSSTT